MQRDHGNCVSYLRLGFFSRHPYCLPEPIIHAVVIRTFSYYRPDSVLLDFFNQVLGQWIIISGILSLQNLLVIGTRCKSNRMKNISDWFVQGFSVKPPNMLPPLFTMVTVGPLLSHFEWKTDAAKPSREARNSKRHSPPIASGNQAFKTLRCCKFVKIIDSANELRSEHTVNLAGLSASMSPWIW